MGRTSMGCTVGPAAATRACTSSTRSGSAANVTGSNSAMARATSRKIAWPGLEGGKPVKGQYGRDHAQALGDARAISRVQKVMSNLNALCAIPPVVCAPGPAHPCPGVGFPLPREAPALALRRHHPATCRQ